MGSYPEFYQQINSCIKKLRRNGKLRFLRESELVDLAQEAVCYYAVHGSAERAVLDAYSQFKPPQIIVNGKRQRQYEIPTNSPQAFLYQDTHDPHERFEIPRKNSLPFAKHFDKIDKAIQGRLSDWEYEIYLCYFRYGLTQAETAEEIGTTQQNICYHIKKIRQKLQR